MHTPALTSHAGATSQKHEILGVVVQRIILIVVNKRIFESPKATRYASVDVASRQTRLNQHVLSLKLSQTTQPTIQGHYIHTDS